MCAHTLCSAHTIGMSLSNSFEAICSECWTRNVAQRALGFQKASYNVEPRNKYCSKCVCCAVYQHGKDASENCVFVYKRLINSSNSMPSQACKSTIEMLTGTPQNTQKLHCHTTKMHKYHRESLFSFTT